MDLITIAITGLAFAAGVLFFALVLVLAWPLK